MKARYGNDMRYSPYPKYKPSGIVWLGDVPETWNLKRLRLNVRLGNEKGENDGDNPLPFVGLENVESWTGKLLFNENQSVSEGVSNYFKSGNTLFGKLRPYLAKACNVDFDGFCSSDLLVMKEQKLNRAYLLYTLLSEGFIGLVDSSSYGVKMPRASWDFIGSIGMPVPSDQEQDSIASFLNRETAKIDALVGKRQQLIDKLKEKRTALISRTVTRGLPPEAAKIAGLNPHPKLKPPGVEWLGEIPEHWEVKRVKTVATYRVSNVDKVPADDERPVRLCNYTDVYYNEFVTPDMKLMETTATLDEVKRFRLHPGDVVITKDSEEWNDIAVPALVKESAPDLLCGYHLAFIRPNPKRLAGSFLFRCFQAEGVNQQFQVAASGVTRYGLPKSSIGSAWIAVPPLAEQKKIAAFVETQTAKIDQMVEKVESAIVKLQEYRTALITAAVTGKIDVRKAS